MRSSFTETGTEGSSSFSADRAVNGYLAGHLAAVLTASNQETVWSLTTRFLRQLGFDHAFYGYSPDSRGAQLGSPDDYQILSTLPHDVMIDMVEHHFYRESTTFHWALRNTGIALWSWSAEQCGVDPDFEVSPAATEFFLRNNLLTGCTVGFPKERTRGNAVMALAGPAGGDQAQIDAMVTRLHDVIFVTATVAHRSLTSLPFNPPRGKLTPRQREVLEWVAEGKTSADIATIMGLSAPTVEKHLRLARETLGVETTAHALIKAAFLNQVFIAQDASAFEPGASFLQDRTH